MLQALQALSELLDERRQCRLITMFTAQHKRFSRTEGQCVGKRHQPSPGHRLTEAVPIADGHLPGAAPLPAFLAVATHGHRRVPEAELLQLPFDDGIGAIGQGQAGEGLQILQLDVGLFQQGVAWMDQQVHGHHAELHAAEFGIVVVGTIGQAADPGIADPLPQQGQIRLQSHQVGKSRDPTWWFRLAEQGQGPVSGFQPQGAMPLQTGELMHLALQVQQGLVTQEHPLLTLLFDVHAKGSGAAPPAPAH